jgi:hypothetical protein
MFLELSLKWYLECPVCQYSFVIADSELKTDEFSLVRIRQTYPDKPQQESNYAGNGPSIILSEAITLKRFSQLRHRIACGPYSVPPNVTAT